MTLVYPKDRHTRTQRPREYKDYSSYKPYLRTDFVRRCVYCRAPDTWRGPQGQHSYGADHYRPKSKFPELVNIYTNLFYCCNQCNTRKSNFWPADDELEKKFIPNPCDHRMFEHLRYSDGQVEARTPAGEFTVEHLDLNDPQVVGYRRTMAHMLEVTEATLHRTRSQKEALKKKYAEGKVAEDLYRDALLKLDARAREGENAIAMLSGNDPVHP